MTGGEAPVLPSAQELPFAWHSCHHPSPRWGLGPVSSVSRDLRLWRPGLWLPEYLRHPPLLAAPGWASGSGSPRYQKPRSKRGDLLGSMVSLRPSQGSSVMARRAPEPRLSCVLCLSPASAGRLWPGPRLVTQFRSTRRRGPRVAPRLVRAVGQRDVDVGSLPLSP